MSTPETKATLEQEKKRCLDFLRDKQMNLPSHLQQNADILSTESHLEMINKKLEKISKAEEKAAKEKQKMIADSLLKVHALDDKLYAFKQEIDAEVANLYHEHKNKYWAASKAITLLLQTYKPKKKTA